MYIKEEPGDATADVDMEPDLNSILIKENDANIAREEPEVAAVEVKVEPDINSILIREVGFNETKGEPEDAAIEPNLNSILVKEDGGFNEDKGKPEVAVVEVKVEPDMNSILIKEDGFNEIFIVEKNNIKMNDSLDKFSIKEEPVEDDLVSIF